MSAQVNGARDGGAEAWLSQRERGVLWLMRATLGLAFLAGRRATKPLVALIALWYLAFDRSAVAASRKWLTRVHGRPPSQAALHRHLATFAQVTLDRGFLAAGRLEGFEFHRHGLEHLRAQRQSGRGALLLGSHLGSYESLRAGGELDDLVIHVLGYFANASRINALLEQLSGDRRTRVLHLGQDPVGVMTAAAARVAAGDFVAVLGDRIGLGGRNARATLLGAEAEFPVGAFLMAHLLRCPVYLVFGLYTPPNRYDLYCEPFAERIQLPRRERDAALAEWTARYAARLEARARSAPDNWFNFFDFWSGR